MTARELEVELERFQGVYEASIDAIVVVDAYGVITGFNPAAEETFGYTKASAIGEQMADLLVPPQFRRHHHEGFAKLRETGHSRILGQRVEVSAMRSDGNEFPAELVVAEIATDPPRYCAYVRDITEERRRHESLQELARDNAQILSAAGDGIYRVDSEGQITYANPAAAKLLGYEAGELIGHQAHELLHHARADGSPYPVEACPIREARRSGKVTRSTSEVFWRKDGTPFAVDFTSAPVREGDHIVGAVCVFADITEEREREAELRERAEWTERVHVAARSDAFVLHGQPIYSLASDEVVMSELLVRLHGSDGELLYPGAFIPQAERFGLMAEIDRWVFAQAIPMSRLHPVSVNLSATTLDDGEFAIWAEQAILEDGEPSNLTIEITETAALANMRDAEAVASRLGSIGCKLALDDFGTGYGSFSEIRRMPVSYLKIDRSFVSEMVQSEEDARIVGSIVALAKNFDMKTIAEGVENQETLELLREMGVDFAQGFHLGRPAQMETAEAGSDRPPPSP